MVIKKHVEIRAGTLAVVKTQTKNHNIQVDNHKQMLFRKKSF